MNDEFLYRLRKDPPHEFAARLKACLDLQASASAPRFSTLRTVLVGLLIGGSALAATLWIAKGVREDDPNVFGTREAVPADAQAIGELPPRANGPFGPNAPREDRASYIIESTPADPVNRFESDAQSALAEENEQTAIAHNVPNAGISATVGLSGGKQSQSAELRLKVVASQMTHLFATRLAERHQLDAIDIERIDEERVFHSFCGGPEKDRADVVLAARTMTDDEIQACVHDGTRNIAYAKIGYHGVVITAAKTAGVRIGLSPRDVFLALAKQIPDPADSTRLIDNPNYTWNHANPKLDYRSILVFGPAPESALGHAFSELVLEVGCDTFAWIRALKQSDPTAYRGICHAIRKDGLYAPIEQTNVFITQQLWAEPHAIAVLGITFFDAHHNELIGNLLDGPWPTVETIDSGAYPYARALHMHANTDRTSRGRNADRFLHMSLSAHAIGPYADLSIHGFIPLRAVHYPPRTEKLRITGRATAASAYPPFDR